MMKKLAAMLLTGVMALSLAACGGSSGAATSNDSTEATGDAAEAPAAEEAAPAADATDENTFVVGFDAEYPPYGYLDEATGSWHRSFATAAAGHWSSSPSTGTTRTQSSTVAALTAFGTA